MAMSVGRLSNVSYLGPKLRDTFHLSKARFEFLMEWVQDTGRRESRHELLNYRILAAPAPL